MLIFPSVAYAMGAGGAQGGGQADPIHSLVFMIVIFGIFYFLLIRPQQKKMKQHRQMLANLKKGDNVMTSGGIHGKIAGITDSVVTLEVADKVLIKVSRSYVGDTAQSSTAQTNAKEKQQS
ncbi:MAG: preprotein translocase subunit YajC [Pseudomonadota bacterium]